MTDNGTRHVNALVITRPDPGELPDRNVYPLFGRPLIAWTLDALKHCPPVSGVFVCTGDPSVARAAREAGCVVVPCQSEPDNERATRVEILRHAVTWLYHELNLDTDIAIAVRASIPELRSRDVDHGVAFLQRHNLREVISVSPKRIQNDDLRFIHRRELFSTALSHHVGVMKTDYVDVRSLDDVADLQTRYESRERFDALRE